MDSPLALSRLNGPHPEFLALPISSPSATRRQPQLEDLLAFVTAADAQLAADGQQVAYTVTTTNEEEDGYQSHTPFGL